ncbi:protein ABHD18 isoform X3 [Dendroctonus ponderosae]|uniref:protein ABHD18 isoform X3 n=1 Tax=Dendroctonus ponderosae TaxID=77166 RepID=UPI002035E867|nr:protein ABHD18 isoform X3 [Dendroctonus ponderosae]
MPVSRLDVIYRKLLLTKFFTKGWGVPAHLERLFNFRKIMSNRETCCELVPKDYPITIINSQKYSDCHIVEGKFRSPFALHLPGLVSPEVQDAFFQMVLPLQWSSDYKPMCIHLAGTGDHMASLAATNWPKPLVLVPCLSWSTASSVFTEGVMSESINWDMLQDQYMNDQLYCEQLSKACKIVDDPFACNLSKSFTDSQVQYGIDLAEELKASYVTPYELVNVIKMNDVAESSCQAITDKASSAAKEKIISRISSIKNIPPFIPSKNIIEMKKRAKEALWFMRGMMDECTHLKNFSVPVDTSLVISITAKTDGYVPRRGVSKLDEIWPGATVKYLDCGHVGAYIFYRNIFRDAIIEAFNKAKKQTSPSSPAIHDI